MAVYRQRRMVVKLVAVHRRDKSYLKFYKLEPDCRNRRSYIAMRFRARKKAYLYGRDILIGTSHLIIFPLRGWRIWRIFL